MIYLAIFPQRSGHHMYIFSPFCTCFVFFFLLEFHFFYSLDKNLHPTHLLYVNHPNLFFFIAHHIPPRKNSTLSLSLSLSLSHTLATNLSPVFSLSVLLSPALIIPNFLQLRNHSTQSHTCGVRRVLVRLNPKLL